MKTSVIFLCELGADENCHGLAPGLLRHLPSYDSYKEQ